MSYRRMTYRMNARGYGSPLRYFVLSVGGVLTAFPFYVMVVLALREPGPLIFPEALLPTNLTLGSLKEVLSYDSLWRWVINTIVYSVVSVVVVLLVASLAGYAFAKLYFFGRNVLFWLVLSTVLVPFHMSLIPVFLTISRMKLVDTMPGLILPTLANIAALFLMRQFIRALPNDLFDAARIDGASELRVYWSIVVPLTRPVLATLGVFTFLWHWNDFLWPLVVARTDQTRPLTVGLASLQLENASVSVSMASAMLSFIPVLILFIFLQRYFVRGIAMSGVKG